MDREPGGRRFLALGIGILVALLLGFSVGRWSLPDESIPDASEPNDVQSSPTEFTNSEDGAVAAATHYSHLLADASAEPDNYEATIQGIAAPEWKSDARALTENTLRFLKERYGTNGSFAFVPIRYRVVDYGEADARIEVWGVTLASGSRVPGIEETWITGTLDLTWIDGRWLISGQKSASGPTPELVRAEDDRTGNPLATFKEYHRGPTP